MERFFWQRMSSALGAEAGRHFVADHRSRALRSQKLAEARGYREVFLNPADIGGRFSALSLFGLVPAALIGAPARGLASGGQAMAEGCRQENHANPGLELGAFIGAAVKDGRDKLTVVLSPSLASLGLWIEQLVAESTGKHEKGALPVVDEPLGRPDEYGTDRAFVAIATEVGRARRGSARCARSGGPSRAAALTTRIDGLGAEFFRWEFATAVAGAALGLNPFDEPNVSEAKEKTKALLAAFAANGRLPEPGPPPWTPPRRCSAARSPAHPRTVIRSAIDSMRPGDYVAFLSYLPAESDVESAVAEVRQAIRSRTRRRPRSAWARDTCTRRVSTTRAGRTRSWPSSSPADDETSTEIPEAGYSFSRAEARAGARRRRDARRARSADRAHPFQRRGRRGADDRAAVRGGVARSTVRLKRTHDRLKAASPASSADSASRAPCPTAPRPPCAGCCRARPS